MDKKYILDGRAAKQASLMEWAQWFETADRNVAKTFISDNIYVSTVFLGINHQFGDGPPVLFETMIFGGEHDQYQDRYETWEQAERGHEKAVKIAKL